MRKAFISLVLSAATLVPVAWAQGPDATPVPPATPRPPKPPSATGRPDPAFAERPEPAGAPVAQPVTDFVVTPGTRILLNMINSVSTKQAQIGDRLYLETAFPIVSNGKIVIPQGSWVTGTISAVKRPGKVKGKGELEVHFDSLVLPNGVSRNFAGDLAAIDSRDDQKLRREGSKITGPGDKRGDVGTVISSTTSGTVIGSGVGAAAGNIARGAGIGAGAGAAAGLIGTLFTRGPDAMLTRGSTVEMVLDRPLQFAGNELDFHNAPPRGGLTEGAPRQPQTQQRGGWPTRSPL